MTKKILSALLALLITAAVFAGCSGNDDPKPAGTTGAKEDTSADTGRAAVKDQLPEKMDFDGSDVVFHTRGDNDAVIEIFVEADNTADRINAAVYNRNKKVEERLNVSIKQYSDHTWETYHESLVTLRAVIQNGDNSIDIVSGWSAKIPAMMTYNCFVDLQTVKNLYLEEPWWSQMMNESCVVNNKLYFTTGDIATSYTNTCFAYIFNKRVLEDNKSAVADNLYDVVRNGEWTINFVDRAVKNLYTDVNNDGVKDTGDKYGMTIDCVNPLDAHLQGFQVYLLSRDDSGRYFMDADLEQLDSIVQKLYSLIYNNEGVGYRNEANYSGSTFDDKQSFLSGNVLFYPTYFWDVMMNFGSMADEYGVLPYPKWDTDQKEYSTRLSDGLALFSIPTSAKNIDMSGAVMEAMAAESYRNVTTEVYDVVLKGRYAQDDDSKEMMDIVTKNKYLNFEIIYNESFWAPWYLLRNTVNKGNNNFSSWWAENEGKFNSMLSDLMDQFYE